MSAPTKGLTFMKEVLKFIKQKNGFDAIILKNATFTSAGDGKCVCELKVDDRLLNSGGTLHGGATASLVDMVSTLALMTTERGAPGVSVDMNISYMKAGKLDSNIIVDAATIKQGKRLAFLTVDIKDKETGAMLAQGKHTKFIG